jgi:GDP-L-fucose synthase
MIRKFHEAKLEGRSDVTIWGSGSPKREFLHVDDLADACVFLMQRYSESMHINVGTGEDLSIRELAELVQRIVSPTSTIVYDTSKPDGMPKKLLDVTRLHALGWRHRTALGEGIEGAYEWFLGHLEKARGLATT